MRPTRCLLPVLLSISIVPAPAHAAPPQSAPPAELVADVTAELREGGVTAAEIARARRLYRPVSLTGPQTQIGAQGGAQDWLVDMRAAPSGMLCGTGGCPVEVWTMQGGRYRRAFALQALDFTVAAGRRLEVSLNGVLCGATGSEDCRYAFAWVPDGTAGAGWFLQAPPPGEARGYAGPIVQADPQAIERVPPALAARDGFAAWCRSGGGEPDTEDALALLPDLTGDARPEALFDANRATCTVNGADGEESQRPCPEGEEACRSLLLVSAPQGWTPRPRREPFDYWIRWDERGAHMAVAAPDCGMCEIEELDLKQ
ncbi:hypothetical protein [Novosphingobium cyanobacteriorum]|uniref:Secreted protein n=1 Tax=Novosphingobium cyanobacteriorum TaxID=3024215 RepID=A0ABT6CFV4_9SPHN|nr:hypothetical protein [Novosphingobium cyanobacteriorum]MDF8332803.1 hypothetical protein [Novosphingobium cyanobacteriorum]